MGQPSTVKLRTRLLAVLPLYAMRLRTGLTNVVPLSLLMATAMNVVSTAARPVGWCMWLMRLMWLGWHGAGVPVQA